MFTRKNIRLACISLALIMAFTGFVLAEERPENAPKTELKPQSTCPVMSGRINKELYVDVDGKRIYVCCEGCLDLVKKDPAAALKKLAELGEYAEDAPMVQKTCPIMGRPINKDLFVEYEGKKLYVCCKACLEIIKKDPAKYAKVIEDGMKQDTSKDSAIKAEPTVLPDAAAIVWTCSMHPQIRLAAPGKCPICGMALIPAKQVEKSEVKASEKKSEPKASEKKLESKSHEPKKSDNKPKEK